MTTITVRQATPADIEGILRIYNQGIEDRIATLETEMKNSSYMEAWFNDHQGKTAFIKLFSLLFRLTRVVKGCTERWDTGKSVYLRSRV
ncbi:hypothetical protein D3C75_452800 [compost metagenome]